MPLYALGATFKPRGGAAGFNCLCDAGQLKCYSPRGPHRISGGPGAHFVCPEASCPAWRQPEGCFLLEVALTYPPSCPLAAC